MRAKYLWISVLILPFVLFAFQNCGQGFSQKQIDQVASSLSHTSQGSSTSDTSGNGSTTDTSTPTSMTTATPSPTPTPVVVLDQPPVITALSKGGTLIAGARFTLQVTATGTNLKYQWSKDNTPIVGATSGSLALNPLAVANTGNYTVSVMNTGGSVASSSTFTVVDFNNTHFVSPAILNNMKMEITHTGGSIATGRFINYFQNSTTVYSQENFQTRFHLADMVLLADGKYAHHFDQFAADLHTITPLSSTAVTNYNANKLCGLTGWKINVARDILGSTCDPNPNTPTSGTSRVAIENNAIVHYLGVYSGVPKTMYPSFIDANTRTVGQ